MTQHIATLNGMNQWWEWVQAVAIRRHDPRDMRRGEISGAAIAKRMGVDQSTPNGWRTKLPSAENAALFAKVYEQPVLDAFVACGWITREEAGQPAPAGIDVADLDDDHLVAEVKRLVDVVSNRMKELRADVQKMSAADEGVPGSESSADEEVSMGIPGVPRSEPQTPGTPGKPGRPLAQKSGKARGLRKD